MEPTIESRGRGIPRRPLSPAEQLRAAAQPKRSAPPERRPPATIPSLPLLPDRYRPVRELGRGGMGIVLLVKDRELDREAALKLILPGKAGPKALARFMREAAITAQLAHPSIMPVYDAGRTDDGSYFMVLKFIEGEGLDARLARHLKGEPFPLGEKLSIMQRLCEAAGYMHSRGFVHRDIKPANVMLGKHGEVILADLGLARRYEQDDEEPGSMVDEADLRQMEQLAGRTMDGSVIGTPAYMAPEQAKGAGREIVPATDVWALGGVLYALLTGEAPYPVRDPMAALKLARAGRVEPVAVRLRKLGREAVSRELSSVLARAMDPQAARRYVNGLMLGDELVRLVAREPVQAHRYGPAEKLSLFVRRRPGMAATGAAGLLFAATISAVAAFAMQGISGAEAERARAAERATAAELARQAAEASAGREAMQRAFQEGRVEDLEQQLGVAVKHRRAAALDRYVQLTQPASSDGLTSLATIDALPSTDIEEYIGAFHQAEEHEQRTGQRLLGPADYYALALIYRRALSSPGRAVAPLQEAIRRGERRPAVKSMLGLLVFETANRDEGLRLLQDVVSSAEGVKDYMSWLSLSRAYLQLARFREARDALWNAEALNPPPMIRQEIATLRKWADENEKW